WAFVATRPKLYHLITSFKIGAWKMLAGKRTRFSWLPFMSGWTNSRDFPVPSGKTFMNLWKQKNK
ncbi:MAG: DUF3390 domain-containing protein, partial [Rhodospirillaceae bacterium]|nr:DUF3390 domain-containing protein [Rhodospirillaceae bacterium]